MFELWEKKQQWKQIFQTLYYLESWKEFKDVSFIKSHGVHHVLSGWLFKFWGEKEGLLIVRMKVHEQEYTQFVLL